MLHMSSLNRNGIKSASIGKCMLIGRENITIEAMRALGGRGGG